MTHPEISFTCLELVIRQQTYVYAIIFSSALPQVTATSNRIKLSWPIRLASLFNHDTRTLPFEVWPEEGRDNLVVYQMKFAENEIVDNFETLFRNLGNYFVLVFSVVQIIQYALLRRVWPRPSARWNYWFISH